MQIYYNATMNKYYALMQEGIVYSCDICHKVIEMLDTFVYQRSYTKKQQKSIHYCHRCFTKPNKQLVDEFRIVQLTGIIPHGSLLCLDVPPLIINGSGRTVFELGRAKQEGVQTNNYCKIAVQADRNKMPLPEHHKSIDLEKLQDTKVLDLILYAEPLSTKEALRLTTTSHNDMQI